MTFKDWIFSDYPNPHIDGAWGLGHILTLLACIGIIITLSIVFSKRSEKAKRIVLFVFSVLILIFGITRRVVNIIKGENMVFHDYLHILLPRPWCAISCWLVIISTCINKKFMYNLTSITALLCAIIFFAYPGVGFNNKYMLFENIYSIGTHSLFLIVSILYITFGFTKFEYKSSWKEIIGLVCIFVYAILEIYVLKIADDPLYFMPNSDIQDILGIGYGLFLPLYIVFIVIYWNIFYLINDRKKIFKPLKNKKDI